MISNHPSSPQSHCELTSIPPLVERIHSGRRLVFPVEPSVHVSNQVVSDVVTDVHFEQVAELDEFTVDVLVCVSEKERERESVTETRLLPQRPQQPHTTLEQPRASKKDCPGLVKFNEDSQN